jgi:hypothetical protein
MAYAGTQRKAYLLGAQTLNVIFLETVFPGKCISIEHSTTNNDLPSNNLFRFQSNRVKVSRISESRRNDSKMGFPLFVLSNKDVAIFASSIYYLSYK